MVIRHSYQRQETTFRALNVFFFYVINTIAPVLLLGTVCYYVEKYTMQTTDASGYFIYNLIKAGLMFLFQCNQNIPLVKFSHLANADSRNEEYPLLLC